MGEQAAARMKRAYSSAGESARLISVRSMVRVHLTPLKKRNNRTWGYSSAGRAPALQAGGQGFESLYLHLIETKKH